MSHYAVTQLKTMVPFRSDIKARTAYYNDQPEIAQKIILKGLLDSSYPGSLAYATSKLMLSAYEEHADTSEAHQLLKSLMLSTSTDVVPKEELKGWYQKLDGRDGGAKYQKVLAEVMETFQAGPSTITLPKSWKFLAFPIPPDQMSKIKYFLVDVWYTGCLPCIDEIPKLNAFQDKIKGREDIRFISINTDYKNGKRSEEHVAMRSKDLKVAFPVVYDNSTLNLSKQLKVTGYPSKFIVDSKGKVIVKRDNSAIGLKTFDLFIKELDNGKFKRNR